MTAPTTTTTGTPLEVSGLHAAYGPVQVLHGIDFRVDEG